VLGSSGPSRCLPLNDVTPISSNAPGRSGGATRLFRDRWLLLAAAIAAAAAVVLVVWLVAFGDGQASNTAIGGVAAVPVEPVALSAAGVTTLAAGVGQPIYWAGPRKGYLYELRRIDNGNTYVRYLPRGVDAGTPGAEYLTVATYPFPDAFETLEKAAGDRAVEVEGGGVALVAAKHPTSVHLAYPGVDYQVEVCDPSPAKALQVARSGSVRPAG
jgi:hypothetical protein